MLDKFLEYFITLMRQAYQRKIGLLRKWSVDVAGLGREGSMRFLAYCERMMRENSLPIFAFLDWFILIRMRKHSAVNSPRL